MPYQIKNGIIYGSNAVSLTQAQYDALSTAEKNNGTVYYIYDVDDIYSGNVVKNVVLSASKWASDAYTITDHDITGANIVFLTYPPSISDEMYSAIQSANIRVTNQTNGSITLQALGGAPSINLTVTLIIQGIDMGLQTAEYVTYDNSTSGLEAVNVQEAVDELSNGLTHMEWKEVGSVTGRTALALPSEFNEIQVNVTLTSNYQVTQHFTKAELNGGWYLWGSPYYTSGGSIPAFATAYISTTSYTLYSARYGSSETTSTAVSRVYYR